MAYYRDTHSTSQNMRMCGGVIRVVNTSVLSDAIMAVWFFKKKKKKTDIHPIKAKNDLLMPGSDYRN